MTRGGTHPYNAPDSLASIEAPLSTFALDRVTAQFPEAVAERYLDRTGGAWAVIHAEHLPKVAAFLKNELDFKLFTSIDAVDRLPGRGGIERGTASPIFCPIANGL